MLKIRLNRIAQYCQQRLKAYQGSASMIFMSLAFLTLLLSVNTSLSVLQKDLATTGVQSSTLSGLESVANSAMQDVFSTKFFPASNRLNWQFSTPSSVVTTSNNTQLKPLFRRSSFIMENGQVLARYQYIIVGGHPARDILPSTPGLNYLNLQTATNPWAAYTRLTAPESVNIQQPLYVLLRVFGCESEAHGNLQKGSLIAVNGQPTCGIGTNLRHFDSIAKVILNPATTTVNANKFQIDRISRSEFDTTGGFGLGLAPITLDSPVMLPDGTSSTTVQFAQFCPNTLSTASSENMATLERILLEPSTPITDVYDPLFRLYPTNLPTPIFVTSDTTAAVSKLHLYFRGSLDTRSLFQYQFATAINDNVIQNTNLLNFSVTGPFGTILTRTEPSFNYPFADHLTLNLDVPLACGSSYSIKMLPPTGTDIRMGIRDGYGFLSTGSGLNNEVKITTDTCISYGTIP
jgi:hypothetical protein